MVKVTQGDVGGPGAHHAICASSQTVCYCRSSISHEMKGLAQGNPYPWMSLPWACRLQVLWADVHSKLNNPGCPATTQVAAEYCERSAD